MKKLLFIFIFILSYPTASISQKSFSYSILINEIWGEWHAVRSGDYKLSGYLDDFYIYRRGLHPSEYIFRLKITKPKPHPKLKMDNIANAFGSKKARRRLARSRYWVSYEGQLEIPEGIIHRNYVTGFPYVSTHPRKDIVKVEVRVLFKRKGNPTYNIHFPSRERIAISF